MAQQAILDKTDLDEVKNDLQLQLQSYMSRLSDLKIHKETLELELGQEIQQLQDKLQTNQATISEKEELVNIE